MLLRNLRQILTSERALIPGAACYAAVFCLLIYDLALQSRLDAWRQLPAQTAAPLQPQGATHSETDAACAELAGMGQNLCNAEAKFDAARARFQQRVAARKQRPAENHINARPPASSPARTPLAKHAEPSPSRLVFVGNLLR